MFHIISFLGAIFCSMVMYADNNSPDEEILNHIIQDFTNEMEQRYGLYCVGSGGITHGKIEKIDLMFETHRRASLEEAREIQVNTHQRLLEMINSNEELKSHLLSIPFSKRNISLNIGFVNPIGSRYNDGSIASTGSTASKIYYNTSDLFLSRFVEFHEEAYEEALKIVQERPLPYDVRFHKEVGYEQLIDALCTDFARRIYKKYGIQCEGFGGKFSSTINEVAFSLVRKKSTPLEKARQYEVEITRMLLDMINGCEKLRPYLSNYPFTACNTQIHIHCWHGQGVHFQDGSVSRMTQKDGKISYFKEKPPTQHILTHSDADLIMQEDFAEAEKSLKLKKGFFFKK